MKIRTILPGDKKEWLRLRCALWPECPQEHHALEMEQLRSERNAGVVLVVERKGGGLSGFAEISIRHDHVDGASTAPVAYLEGWYIEAASRGGGIGRKLIEVAEQWAARQGFAELASDAELENPAGIRAHAACGFRETGRTVHFIKQIGVIKPPLDERRTGRKVSRRV